MTQTPQASPAAPPPSASRWSNAIGPLILGGLLIVGPAACTGMAVPALSDPSGAALGWLVIYACAPLMAAGFGLAVLALSRAYGAPGKPPLWRVAAGWLLIAFSAAYLALPVWNEMQSDHGDLGSAIFAAVLMAVPAGLVAWLGLKLARPKP